MPIINFRDWDDDGPADDNTSPTNPARPVTQQPPRQQQPVHPTVRQPVVPPPATNPTVQQPAVPPAANPATQQQAYPAPAQPAAPMPQQQPMQMMNLPQQPVTPQVAQQPAANAPVTTESEAKWHDWGPILLNILGGCCTLMYLAWGTGIIGAIWAAGRIVHFKQHNQKVPALLWVGLVMSITMIPISIVVYSMMEGYAEDQLINSDLVVR